MVDLRRRFASMASTPQAPKGLEASFRPEDNTLTVYPVGERSPRLSREQADALSKWIWQLLNKGSA